MRLAPLALLLASACGAERDVQLPEPPKQDKVTSFDIPADTAVEYDILVVVDSSPAMATHAERAIPQLATLISGLAQRGDPDWHLGVLTSDLGGEGCTDRGDDALFRHAGLVGAPFLIEWRHLDQRHTTNYEGSLADAFARLATVGTAGCPRQQPLAAIRRALDEQPRNAGFRREGANLVILIVGAGDDASPEPVVDHIAFLSGAAPGQRVFVGGIFDQPAPRLDELVAAFPFRSDVTPLREPSLDLYIPMFGAGHWGVPCLEGVFDPDPECSISDVLVEDEVAVHERLIPRCDGRQSVKPCWHLETDVQRCPDWGGSESRVLEIERHDYAPLGTHVRGSCVTR